MTQDKPVPNTCQVVMQYSASDQICENVYHFLGTAGWTPQNLTDLCTQMAGWEASSCRAQRNTSSVLLKITAKDLSVADGQGVELATHINGTLAGAPAPNNVTLAISLKTGFTGRGFRGRTYWVGMGLNQIDANGGNQSATAGAISAMEAAISALLAGGSVVIPNGGGLAIVSRYLKGAQRPVPLSTLVKNVTVTDTYLDSMRRRLPGHNRHH